MKRSAGVTAIVILSLLGSVFTFAMGILVLVMMIMAPVSSTNPFPGSPSLFNAMLVLASLMYLLPAVWGIVTGIGLWRLKNWARVSIVVFSVLLILMGGFSGLVTLIVPFPPTQNSSVDPSIMTSIRISMAAFMLALAGIGVWWLVFFNRSTVKEQFGQLSPAFVDRSPLQTAYPAQGTAESAAGKRPLSIAILAWFLLVGCMFLPLWFVFRTPVILFTRLLTGWPAVLLCLGYAAVQVCIGVGLLRLRPAARTAAIIYFLFGFVNSAIFYFAPGGHARMLALIESQQTMFPWMRLFLTHPEFQFDPTRFMVIGYAGGVIGIMVPLYFLITRKVAFEKAAAELESGASQA